MIKDRVTLFCNIDTKVHESGYFNTRKNRKNRRAIDRDEQASSRGGARILSNPFNGFAGYHVYEYSRPANESIGWIVVIINFH